MKQPQPRRLTVDIDETGSLRLPEDVLLRWGMTPGKKLLLQESSEGLVLRRVDPPLSRIYVEPTSLCNLSCRTCVRHSWSEPTGTMSMKSYRKLIQDLSAVPTLQRMSFWGFGEPLLHPDIIEMIALAKGLGVQTQMITNALLLDESKAVGLVEAGLDSIVISVDGTTPSVQAEIRSGADLNVIMKNVGYLRSAREKSLHHAPEIGLEFVMMRSNMKELGNIETLAEQMGASFIVLTNLLPYTEDMREETLYQLSVERAHTTCRSEVSPELFLPPVDLRPGNMEALLRLAGHSTSAGIPSMAPGLRGNCRFINEGSAVVSFNGDISPCIPLMRSYSCFVMDHEKKISRYTLGNVTTSNIADLWEKDEFVAFRERVQRFEFSPCVHCTGCDLSKTNEEDCFGNTFPVCGDCLWAKGIIQCP